MKRSFWFAIGLLALGAAFAGAFLPILPTTPFLLVAAYGFARSSPRMHAWLMNHRLFGPLIHNWREHGAIGVRTKIVSVVSMAAVFLLSVFLKASALVLTIQAVVLVAAALFVLSRPSAPR